MSPAEELQRNARNAVSTFLKLAEDAMGQACSLEQAEGVIEAAVLHVRRLRGPQAAFEMLTRHADDVGKTVLEGQ